jgi:hypothetical protein
LPAENPERLDRHRAERNEIGRLLRGGKPALDEGDGDAGAPVPQQGQIVVGAVAAQHGQPHALLREDPPILLAEFGIGAALGAGRHHDHARERRMQECGRAGGERNQQDDDDADQQVKRRMRQQSAGGGQPVS